MANDPGPIRGGARLQSRPALAPEPPTPPEPPVAARPPSEWSTPVLGLFVLVGIALTSSSFLGTWQFMEGTDQKDLAIRLSTAEDRLAAQRNDLQHLAEEHKRLVQRVGQLEVNPQTIGTEVGAVPGFKLLVNGEELSLEQVAARLGPTAGTTSAVGPAKPGDDAGE